MLVTITWIFHSSGSDHYLLLLIRNLTSSTRSHNPPVITQRKTFNNTLPKLIKYLLVLNQIIGFASGFVIRSSKNRPRQIRLSGSSNELSESRLRPAGAVTHPLQQQRVPSWQANHNKGHPRFWICECKKGWDPQYCVPIRKGIPPA